MAGDAVLVLGATGPSGICVVRELLHRNHRTIAYVRSPDKIPDDLKSNPLLEITTGDIESPLLPQTLARTNPSTIISLLGPTPSALLTTLTSPFGPPLPYPAHYADHILPAMRDHGVARILALCTISYAAPDDESNWTRAGFRGLVRVVMPAAYRAMVGIAGVFKGEVGGLLEGVDWVLMRVPGLVGGAEEMEWRVDREVGGVYAGVVGREWTANVKRGRLARWCVDWVEGAVTVGEGEGGRGRMPAVSAARG
ncbi:uncharacterized protein B0H64DRAFT_440048 [Chaetomium fimeti]|uniref:NAD(P)-binding domain-containing protein n=1 Tax=Chaetomium fimeti TaxID=1854472 RepID=A0AAE0HQ11_9PEZI|nr:hypothetical protein B0H64DRAFT_440048 [Chaetomium fimeti]